MDSQEAKYWPAIPQLQVIPRQFHSLEFEGPFQQCLPCNADLLDSDQIYLVERVFRGTEPIVEYAMCLQCQEEMSSELSAESLERIQQFLSKIDQTARIDRLKSNLSDDGIDAWIDECLLTGKKRADCRGYQIIGLFQGPQIQVSNAPFMLSDTAIAEISGRLSQKTREMLGDFSDTHFGMPPEFCETPDFLPVLL